MKKVTFSIKSILSLFAILFCIAVHYSFSQETKPFSINESPLPQPKEPVNDFANVIDDAVELELNQKIKDFKARTNPQVVLSVAVVNTTGGRDIFEYSLAVYRGWKIGTAEEDNPGALLFVAIDDRKYFTQVSKDLEDELPDALVGQLQRQNLVPAFKQGNYTKGVADTINAYMRTIEAKQGGLAPPTPENIGQTKQQRRQERRGSFSICSIAPCLIILFILLIIAFSRRGRRNRYDRNDRWGGGGGFGGGGGSVLPWIIGSAIANSISNSSSSGWSSGGSSSDWGGSSGGGDWGGFGGGGDAAGGGAGGDW